MKIKKNCLLEIRNMRVSFKMYDKGIKQKEVCVLNHLCLSVDKGEVLAIVGSSGSGKSILASAIMGVLPKNATMTGQIRYNSADLTQKIIDKHIALVPQSISYLDPLIKIGQQVDITDNDGVLLQNTKNLYPFQCSGGMVRKALFATAPEKNPELIIADEPTPGMDLETALESLQSLRDMANNQKAVILITHDIDLAFGIADRVAVFYEGTTLEIANAEDFLKGENHLRHPYTKALFRALPQNDFNVENAVSIKRPRSVNGCIYSDICDHYKADCDNKISMREVRNGMVRCNYAT